MFKIKTELLEFGDIILIKSNSDVSERVRQLSGSQFSHAMLYVGLSSYIDSDGKGVQANNIQRKLFESSDDVKVLRIKDASSKDKLIHITNFARTKIGTEYSVREAFAALRDSSELEAQEPNRQFCTRFVSQAYQSAGINLTDNPDYCLPDELLNSKELFEVLDITREANQAEIEFAESNSVLQTQIEIHNNIFKGIRDISGADIQTFDQLEELLKLKPEYDETITKLVSESGYLTLMDNDFEKNPQHYYGHLFEKFYGQDSLNAAKTILRIDEPLYNGYQHILKHFSNLNQEYPRQYFQMQIELLKRLIEFSKSRLTAANEVWEKLNSNKSFESDFDNRYF